jgi:cytochrome c-type biogenesis protein CcmF
LTSVHAFATDPQRGLFILGFLIIVIGGSLLLYALRATHIRSHGQIELVSRESALLLNNVLLVVAAASVLIGTLYPLVSDALQLGKISVGPPYFNSVFVPLTLPLALLAGVGALLRWKRDSLARLGSRLSILLLMSMIIGLAFPWIMFDRYEWWASIGIVVGVWAVLLTGLAIIDRCSGGRGIRGLATAPLGFYGMTVAHLGIGVFVIGVTLTSAYSEEKNVRLAPGESFEMSNYQFQFEGVGPATGPNYLAYRGRIEVSRNERSETTLFPEKRRYPSFQTLMTEAGIDGGFTRDLYASLGESLDDEGAWSIRLYYRPFIRWIWLGALLMAFGGLLGACDRRYRAGIRQKQVDPVIKGSVVTS